MNKQKTAAVFKQIKERAGLLREVAAQIEEEAARLENEATTLLGALGSVPGRPARVKKVKTELPARVQIDLKGSLTRRANRVGA